MMNFSEQISIADSILFRAVFTCISRPANQTEYNGINGKLLNCVKDGEPVYKHMAICTVYILQVQIKNITP